MDGYVTGLPTGGKLMDGRHAIAHLGQEMLAKRERWGMWPMAIKVILLLFVFGCFGHFV